MSPLLTDKPKQGLALTGKAIIPGCSHPQVRSPNFTDANEFQLQYCNKISP